MNKRFNFIINRRRFLGIALLAVIALPLLFLAPKPAKAIPAEVTASVPETAKTFLEKAWNAIEKAYKKGGAAAFQKAVRTALNKIAYDTSTWLGSGNEGQKPMFVTKGWGDYLTQIGDEAAGSFIEDTVNNWGKSKAAENKCSADYNTCLTANGSTDIPEDTFTPCMDSCASDYSECQVGCGNNPVCLDACSSDKTSCGDACSKAENEKAKNVTGGDAKCLIAYNSCLDSTGATKVSTDSAGVTSGSNSSAGIAVCQPSSIAAKLTIAMGLVDYNRPAAPDCTASEMIKNWDDYTERMTAFRKSDFLDTFKGLFNPAANDLGIYMSLHTDLTADQDKKVESSKTKLIGSGGWLDLQDIAGNTVGMPDDAKIKAEMNKQGYVSNMATFSGDALIDAANVFLNQLASTALNKYMSKLGQTASSNNNSALTDASADPNVRYGETAVQESAAKLLEPDFTTQADYDILSSLAACQDRNNPGPTECVIDDKMTQAVTDKKTVAEAVKEGSLHKDWLFTTDYRDGVYSLRNIQILRKYRIVPVGWEVAAASGKQATLGDLMSCFAANDEYSEYTSNFNTQNQSWCRGLVDPNWVLKAPLNYCAKKGYGSQILNSVLMSVDQADGSAIDAFQVTRAEDYCGDEKTCIKEKADGSCEAYGYCQSERRTWKFNSKSCQPIDNTCSAFTNAATGKKSAYLENTLDYGNCNADSAGCKRYSLTGAYASSTGVVSWSGNTADTAYFSSKLSGCSSADEGCKEMLRVKPGWGSNLVMGADFADDKIGDVLAINNKINNYWSVWSDGTKTAEIIDTTTLGDTSAGKAIRLTASKSTGTSTVSLFSDNANSLLPANLNVASGETYTLSADIYLLAGEKVHLVLGGDYSTYTEYNQADGIGVWHHISVTRNLADKPLSELSFQAVGYGTPKIDFVIRNLKLEMTPWDSGYSAYGAYKVYQKLIPNYLAVACYINPSGNNPDYRLRADAPAACNNFARQCNRDEAGCELYTEASTGFAAAAQAVSSDYCDSSCDGYDLYVARASYFYSPAAEKLIPKKSKICSAEAAGCSEFTNLDTVAAGGEGKEYYTQMKQCIKPGASCADFYTWAGTEESGYQLKSLVLKKDNNGNPAVTTDDSAACTKDIYNLPPSDPGFNPDCQQFYNKAGQISYHLAASTITCSDNCHTYRLSEKNPDTTVIQADCNHNVQPDRFWDANASVCYVCKNGGVWDNKIQACLYQAIPNEGQTCTASQNGCREYNGSLGNNTQLVGAYSFTNGTDGWEGQCGDDAVSSSAANTNNGRSLLYDDNAAGTTQCDHDQNNWAGPASFIRKILGTDIVQGQSYSVKFTASAAAATHLSFAFLNSQGETAYFSATAANQTGSLTIPGNSEWHTYELNLPSLDQAVDSQESLVVIADHDFYLDNLILTAISDRYYLVKNTSQVPDVCYYDMLDNYQGADYNLGCSLYHDRAGSNHYLRQFSRLCQDSAVGCELMVNTANYNDYKPGIWKDSNGNGQCDPDEPECVKVAGDRFFYAIYDESHRCNAADTGCSRLGQAASSGANITWNDVFKNNNPNTYAQSLCNAADAGCEAWQYTDGSGTSYFKNPGDNVCVYRTSTDPTRPGKAWYKTSVLRCDLNSNGQIDGAEKTGSVCATASDCTDNKPCLVDNNDYACPVSYLKTIGFGGGGNQIPIPSESAGLCEAASTGCTEYIDPISTFSANLVLNPSMDSLNGWTQVNGSYQQNITIEPNKLYIFSVASSQASSTLANDVKLSFTTGVSLLREDNNFSTSTANLLTIPANQPSTRFIFHSRSNTGAKVIGGYSGHTVSVQEALIDYQFKQNVDKSSCNGLVNFDNGCVLFNERSVNGAQGLLSLTGGWNAASSTDGQAPVACTAGNCSANRLLKVRPDRVCSSWLDCLTYIQDPETKERTCYALGECNRLNDNNECANFVANRMTILNSSSVNLTTITGYSVLNQYDLASMKEVGLNTEAHYDFEANSPTLYCREASNHGKSCLFDKSIVADSIINSPTNAPTDYPAEGKAYLRVMAGQEMSPHSKNTSISIQPNEDYYLNYLVNTKNSGMNAKVTVYGADDNTPLFTATDKAPNGWERKVHKISASQLTSTSKLSLYLSADATDKEERYVYFDDINIEPVLKVGINNYVAKECRLYPTQDATSCTSKNSQVISDGLEGYCLQHDPANKNVCLLWYPIDQISSAAKSGRSNLGYKGAFPLNYCTEANGDFGLVHKLVGAKIYNQGGTGGYTGPDVDNGCDKVTTTGNGCKYCTGKENDCGDYYLVRSGKRIACIPKDSELLIKTATHKLKDLDLECDDAYTYHEGWAAYDGFHSFICNNDPCKYLGSDGQGIDISADFKEKIFLSENQNADPAVRVYDYDHPTVDEDQLKLISGDTEKVFYPTCNKFVQVVDAAGNNQAWAGRTSKNSAYPYDTPQFFRDLNGYYGTSTNPSNFNFTGYGRLRDLVPFGGATFPDNFNIFTSEPVKFRNQYSSSIDQTTFAGRPYGCKNTAGNGCSSLGYCSLNASVLCLLDTTMSSSTSMINQRSCGSVNGTCVPMWNGSKVAGGTFNSENILKNLFLKSFAGYNYSAGVNSYIAVNGYSTSTFTSSMKKWCASGDHASPAKDTAFNTYWCISQPQINNVKLNGQPASNGGFDVNQPGIYTLTFNSYVDVEQQPLKDLIIDWGDGSVQSLVNQDHHPDVANPHKVYHYYLGSQNQAVIKIKVSDNWGYYCCSQNGGACGNTAESCPKGMVGNSKGGTLTGNSQLFNND